MKQPKISVIIPVYNSQAYLRECLDSVVNQTMEDIEIICVDDGSTDASARLLRSFQDEDMRLRVLLREHCGAGPARNAGIEAAEGRYIKFLDSDDIFAPQALACLYETAEKYAAELVLCSGRNFRTDRRGMEENSHTVMMRSLRLSMI